MVHILVIQSDVSDDNLYCHDDSGGVWGKPCGTNQCVYLYCSAHFTFQHPL